MLKKILPQSRRLPFEIGKDLGQWPRLAGAGALLLAGLSAQAQISGTQAIPSATYPTLASAFTALNAQGVGTGGVTFNLAPGYTETAANLLLTATGTAANPIVFQKGAGTGANPTITAAAGTSVTLDDIIGLQGADYVTFDGLTLTDPTSNATTTTQMEWGFALLKTSTPTVDGCQNVTIRNCAITLQKGTTTMGIYAANHTPASTGALVPTTAAGTNSNNKFYGNTIRGVNNGIYVAGYLAPSPYTLYDQNNEIGSLVSGTAATGNDVGDFGTTATAYGIYTVYQHGVKVQGNTVDSTPAAGAVGPTSLLYGILVSTGGSADLLGNNVTVNTSTLASTSYGIHNNSGSNGLNGAATTVNITGNSLRMTSTTATTAAFYGLYNSASVSTLNISRNTLSNWSRPAATTGANYMLYVSTGATATQNVFSNTVSNFTTAGASSLVYGIYATNNSTVAAQFYDNLVQNISNAGNTTYGMYLVGGNTLDVYRNRVSGLSADGTAGLIYGIYASAPTTNVTNNLIGDFATPNALNTMAQAGLYLAGGTSANAQYNSIYLSGSSSGTNFGTTGLYYTANATTLVTLRNNVVVNNTSPTGTGTVVALRRTSGTAGTRPANLLAATNNNLYFAGTPSATNLIYGEGTTTLVNTAQTLTDYKTLVAGREAGSMTENPPFISTASASASFLQVSTTAPTQLEGSGVPISGISTDFAGTTRSTTAPDLGAYEGTYSPLDLSGPVITGAVLANTSSTANRTLVVTISDVSGVATGSNAPRLYYRKGTTGAFAFVNATSVSGSQYTFTLNYTLVAGGSVAAGDVIQYYVAAQDLVSTPNLSTSPGVGSGVTPPGTTAPAAPGSFQVVGSLSGIYYVGTGTSPDPTRTYATLTAAVNAYNVNVLTGPVTFYLLDATYATAETFPLAFTANSSASATNTLLIKPYTGVNAAIISPGTATSAVLLNAASYITFDGSNTAGGTSRNLTLTSGNSAAGATIWVGSQGSGNGSTNITLRNLKVVGGSTNNTASFGIYASAAPASATAVPSASTYGDDNDNLVIQNNEIMTAYEAIFARANGSVTAYDGLQISENRIGAVLSTSSTAAAGNVTAKGIDIQGAAAPLITRNVVLGMDATFLNVSVAAIELNGNVTAAVISRNAIMGLRQLSTGGWGAFGINLNSAVNTTNTEISNNVIADILTASYTSSTTLNPFGIRLTGGTGTKVYYNSVNLFGSIAPTATYPSPANVSAALLVTSSAVTGLDVRNNIFANTITSLAASGTLKSYAAYLLNASVLATSDNNDYFVGGTNGVLGYVAADVTTLAALRTATSRDANSISADPVFVTNTNLLPANGQVAAGGTPVSVTVDYTGVARPATAPSIGAYQFTPVTIDVAPNALLSPLNTAAGACYGANTPVTIQIRNNGSQTLNLAANPLTVTVVIGGPAGSTQTLTQTISTGTLASVATQNITFTGLANFAPLGTYAFAITATVAGDLNTSNDLLAPAPTLTVAAPVAGVLSPATYSLCVSGSTTLTLAGAANGSIQYQSSTSAAGPFTNISGATATTYTTPTLTQTTYYRAQVICGANVATSNVSTVVVNNPVVSAAPSPLNTCTGGTATLSATVPAGISVRYFTSATGGTAIGTGTPFVTPALTVSTTYYAEAFAGNQEFAGPAAYNSTGQTPQTGGALYFTTTAPTTLTTVTVFLNAAQAAGTVTIDLFAGSTTTGTALHSNALAVPAGPATGIAPYVVTLNYPIPAAGQYTLYLRSATQGGLLRDASGSNTMGYPFTSSSGLASVTGSSLAGYYYYFYNLQFASECVNAAARTPIVVNVSPGLVASLPVAAATICGSATYQLAGTIAGAATGSTYTTSGTGTFAPNATTLNATYTPSAADVAAGTVTLTLTPTGPTAACTSLGRVTLTLVAPANTAFSYPAGTYCAGAATTVGPVLATGAVAGTFSTTGTGLRLDPVTGVINLATQTSSGTFTITNTVAATGVCSSTSSTTTITINPAIITPTLTVQPLPGGGVQLSTNPVAGVLYQFFVGGQSVGAASAAFSVTVPNVPVNGSYTVVLVVPGGCSSAPSAPVLVTATATANPNGVRLRVYPNPTADGLLTLLLEGPAAKASSLTVLNALGQVVHTGMAAAGETQLNLARLAAGVYTVRVLTPDGVLTQRMVRQ